MPNLIKLAIVIFALTQLTGCISATKAVRAEAGFEAQEALYRGTTLGTNTKQLVSTFGYPQRTFTRSGSDVSLLLYCGSGFMHDLYIGFFVHDVFGYFDGFISEKAGVSPTNESLGFFRVKGTPVIMNNCHHDKALNWSFTPSSPDGPIGWEKTVYNVDKLRVTTLSREQKTCMEGDVHKISLEGQISPDSSFAIERLLDRLKPCLTGSGAFLRPIISMKSGGGLLKDGYALGKTLRKNQVKAVIEDGAICASSCAVAFLGASQRVVEDQGQVMFHAPYFSGKNWYGQRDINCDVGDDALDDLLNYYKSMTGAETGERLFERTMWYCSAEDGWVVTGGAAAELYGIATEK